ncbi:hypothetical protein [Aquipuribacter sp. SD81]|uniref:hypothetical protein n=1 Tax=Aquipuribacter sp. SD81 TaxID=3127703 RepID=UPI00301A705C
MSRGALALDRVAVALLGLVLLVGGGLLAVWGLGRLPGTVDEIDLGVLRGLPAHPWWPWAVGVAGAVAVLAGLRALFAHTVRPRVRDVTFAAAGDGTDDARRPGGRLQADLPAVADAAAEVLSQAPGVHGCQGRAVPGRDGAVVDLRARVAAETDPAALHRAVQAVADGLARTLPPGTASLRVSLDVRRGRYEAPRVR